MFLWLAYGMGDRRFALALDFVSGCRPCALPMYDRTCEQVGQRMSSDLGCSHSEASTWKRASPKLHIIPADCKIHGSLCYQDPQHTAMVDHHKRKAADGLGGNVVIIAATPCADECAEQQTPDDASRNLELSLATFISSQPQLVVSSPLLPNSFNRAQQRPIPKSFT